MGYTHYWSIDPTFTSEELALIAADARDIILASEVRVAFEYDQPDKPPQLDAEVVRFNGIGEEGHETFYLDTNEIGFAFCKTARKPYDVLVTAILLAAKDRVARLRLSSDGDRRDWMAGVTLARRATRRSITSYQTEEVA